MTKHNFESTRSRPSDGVGQKTGYLGVPKSHVDSFARKKPHYMEKKKATRCKTPINKGN